MRFFISLILVLCCAAPALAIDYGYTGPEQNPVVHAQTDVIHFTVLTAKTMTFAVQGATQFLGCSTRYCHSKGMYKAVILSVKLVNSSGEVVADIMLANTVDVAPGTYRLVIDAMGEGTGSVEGQGFYTASIH